ncbi:RagB/SusD family nutrient uptake outer membrane protein [Litoribacter ruber]|uniref:RagB/SusD family nutrient uptake outer membrane protein n=1 Tax=Litoribacter ruber TaxID=702568 RepID=UPI001BDAA3E4|nr:RagB/SusD family nutrient uptake outer membrane protein [Litoribacter ruber]MBT0812894.1 RagB/SusD family nutrient uptake outer membrane protein [Litoribacter ruber]
MRNYIKIGIVSGLLGLGACDHYLDKEPIGLITQDQISTDPTEQSITSSVNSVYQLYSQTLNIIGDWDWTGGKVVRNDFIVYDMAAGDMIKKWNPDGDQAWMDEVAAFNFTSINGAFNGVWSYNYEAISRANIAIEILENQEVMNDLNLEPGLRDRLLGEVLFLRAFSYFDLVNNFGDVPLITAPLESFEDAYEVSVRTSQAEVWAFLKQDLERAVELLPETKYSQPTEPWRVSIGAAKAMQAKVALFEEDYNAVLLHLNELDGYGFYSLNTHYFDAFDVSQQFNENEVIFAYDHQEARNPGRGNGLAALMGWGFVAPSEDFLGAFEPGDPRLFYTVDVEGRNPNKLLGTTNGQYKGNDDSPGNKIYIRYADALLWRAEALIRTGNIEGGLQVIDEVRARARNTPHAQADFPGEGLLAPYSGRGFGEAEAFQALINERRVELGFESQRFNDLKRWNIADDVLSAMGKNFQDHHYLYPIPQEEVDRSGGQITQNPGY